MEKEIKVSVVVPVYNCERYLADCIESILGQTYENIQLLLVDDGATDESGRICDRYAGNQKVRVIHQRNAGVSRARNRGIAEAEGDYILFVDSDDTIEKEMVSLLVQAVQTGDADCAICGLVHDYPEYSWKVPDQPVQKATDGRGAIREILINRIATAGPVCKMFHRSLLTGKGASGDGIFPDDLTIGEDALAMVEALMGAGRAVFDTQPYYHYNHRAESLMSSPYSERDQDLITAYERIGERLAGQGLEKETIFRRIWAHFQVYDKMIRSDTFDREREKEILSWLRRRFLTIMRNPYVGRMRKAAMCMLMIHKKLYQVIVRRRG